MKAASRVWQRDASLWSTAPEHIKVIANRLGWLSALDVMKGKVDELRAFRTQALEMGLTDAVVLGMGGSSLAPDVMRAIFGQPVEDAALRIHVLDTTDPTTVLNLERQLDLKKTLFIVASKSGTTLEVSAFYRHFRAKLDEIAGRHFVAITDEGTPLQRLATEERFGGAFINPSDIGGRYSALSYFGLLPAALQGLDIARLLERAEQMAGWCSMDSAANPGLYLGALMGGLALNGRDKVTFLISPPLAPFGYWVEQLIAESTGKQGRGIVPVEGELSTANEPVDQIIASLSTDRFFVYLKLAGDQTFDALADALASASAPVIVLTLQDAYDLGAEFFRWEFATAIAGAVIGVNPFDEPNVTESKNNTRRLLEEFEQSGSFSSEQSSRSTLSQVNTFLRQASPGDYVAIQAYLPYTDAVAQRLNRLRGLIREQFSVPVTVGYGPRFLHSTGQLHKGGENNVLALQLTYDPDEDALIAGEPFSFGTLIRAQALGDFEALRTHQRRVMRLHLGRELEASLDKLIDAVADRGRRRAHDADPE